MLLLLVAFALDFLTAAAAIVAVRTALQLAARARDRFGGVARVGIVDRQSNWRTALALLRATELVEEQIANDTELATLRRIRQLGSAVAVLSFLPAVYCTMVAAGRLMNR